MQLTQNILKDLNLKKSLMEFTGGQEGKGKGRGESILENRLAAGSSLLGKPRSGAKP